MILPIKLTNKYGLPGHGVGSIIGAQRLDQSGNEDQVTGESITEESINPGGYINDRGLWEVKRPWTDDGILNTGAIRDSRGSQWKRRGSYRTESAFDRWRRAGKPATFSMRGMGDTYPDGTPCEPGTPNCLTTAERILLAIAAGANAAANPYYGGPVYNRPQLGVPQPQIAVGASASTGAWVLGGIAVVALLILSRQK